MSHQRTNDEFWDAVAKHVAGDCVAYSEEKLAALAEGRLRPAEARVIEAHLEVCDRCRTLVEQLREELAAVQPVFRPAPARPGAAAWKWALAPVALAAVALIVIFATTRPGPQPPGSEDHPGTAVIAERPTAQGPVAPPEAPEAATVTPDAPTLPDEAAGPERPAPARPARERPARRPVPPARAPAQPDLPEALPPTPGVTGEQAVAEAPPTVNALPRALSLAPGDLEALLDAPPDVDLAADPSLINELGPQDRRLLPEAEALESLYEAPTNDMPISPAASASPDRGLLE